MKTICSECSFAFKVPKQMEGRNVKCPQCRHQIEISKPPTPILVKILKAFLPVILTAAISVIICWGYFSGKDQLETSHKITDAKIFFEKKLNAEQQKTQKLANQLKAKTQTATESALRGAEEIESLNEEIDSLNEELSEAHELLDQKDEQIALMIEVLNKLNETVTTESQQKKLQQESNLQQALEKGSDVWSLSGISSLGVTVEIVGDVTSYPLKQEDILKHIQTLLEQNSITVIEESESEAAEKDAVLSIEILAIKPGDSGKESSVNIQAAIKQNTRLLRDDTIVSVGASTWQRQRWHNITPETTDDTTITMIDDLMERFISDFQASNSL